MLWKLTDKVVVWVQLARIEFIIWRKNKHIDNLYKHQDPYWDVWTPSNDRSPAEAINSIEATEEIWCLSMADTEPVPDAPLTDKFPPIAIELRLDNLDCTSLNIAILSIM